ncbi:MAG: hypothetical protein ACUVX1_12840 [Chloroflexota bacterium]
MVETKREAPLSPPEPAQLEGATTPSEQPSDRNKPPLEVFTDMLRALARPAVTIIFAAVIAQVVTEGIPVPDWFLALAIPCITWWFAERTVRHIRENK